MKIEQIKKAAKNLQALLPAFLEQQAQPFKLTALQQLVSQAHGYPNMESATAADGRRDDENEDDPLAAFYRYPWTAIDPVAIAAAAKGTQGSEPRVAVVRHDAAVAWIQDFVQRHRANMQGLTVIAAAGAEGHAMVAQLAGSVFADRLASTGKYNAADDSPLNSFARVGLASLSQRAGLAVNWLAHWTITDIQAVLEAFVKPMCSPAQLEACRAVIEIIVAAVDADAFTPGPRDGVPDPISPPARIKVAVLHNKLQALLALADEPPSAEQDALMQSEFGKVPSARPLITAWHNGRDLRQKVKPLLCLLARLSALGHGDGQATTMDHRERWDNLWFDGGPSLDLVVVDMDSRRLDHVLAMATLAKRLAGPLPAAARARPASPANVLLVTR